jgi:hypothetical protein
VANEITIKVYKDSEPTFYQQATFDRGAPFDIGVTGLVTGSHLLEVTATDTAAGKLESTKVSAGTIIMDSGGLSVPNIYVPGTFPGGTAGTIAVTCTTIPAGALVVALGSCYSLFTAVPSSGGALPTFQQRVRLDQHVTDTTTVIWTSVCGGSPLSNVVVTATTGGDYPALTVLVFTGANTTDFTSSNTGTGTTQAYSLALTGTTAGSYVVGCHFNASGSGTSSPTTGTTEMSDLNDTTNGNSNATNRNTSVSGGGTVTLQGTWSVAGSAEQSHSALEIKAA